MRNQHGNLAYAQCLPNLLDRWVVESASDQSLDIEDCISWVHGSIVLGRFTNQALLVCETDERWGCEGLFEVLAFRNMKSRLTHSLLVGDDLDVGSLIVGNFFVLVSIFRIPYNAGAIVEKRTAGVGGSYGGKLATGATTGCEAILAEIVTYQDRYRSHRRRPRQP